MIGVSDEKYLNRQMGVRPSLPKSLLQFFSAPKQKKQARCLNYPPKSSSSDGLYGTMVSALGELTNTLNKVVKRLEKTESRIMSMEEMILSTTPSSSGSENHFKSRKVPVFVRVSITVFYYTALLNILYYVLGPNFF